VDKLGGSSNTSMSPLPGDLTLRSDAAEELEVFVLLSLLDSSFGHLSKS
jgi:hypothetical protein